MAEAKKTFIPFYRPYLDEREVEEVADTLRSGWLTSGPKVERFEAEFAAYVGARRAIAVNSCTAGLHLALAAAGIGEGDEVITTPFTFCSTVNVVLHQRARPVLADICLDDYNIDPQEVERRITPRTRAIIPVHYAGQPCRQDELLDVARRRSLLVVEDAAHAVGAEYKGRRVGSLGDVTAFSFYATKNLTTGEGGMVTTGDDALAERIRLLSLHGLSHDAWGRYSEKGSWYYQVLAPGFKYNMSDIQAAIGIHQLAKLEGSIAARQRWASLYDRCFQDVGEVATPRVRAEVRHAWHLYVIRLEVERLTIDRARFIELLRERGIGTSVHFIPIHFHPWYRENLGYGPGDFPQAEAAYQGVVSLPLYPQMTGEQVTRVAETVIEVVRAHRR
ncbi:MAG: DegT/DnrJ/EryC1/StrS aminotransferase family protein [Chloroflexota bacterium]|nr:DegT/DnrJ/EryC1/StrS aminotransferase family protein [Chloroflexota bacterium]